MSIRMYLKEVHIFKNGIERYLKMVYKINKRYLKQIDNSERRVSNVGKY